MKSFDQDMMSLFGGNNIRGSFLLHLKVVIRSLLDGQGPPFLKTAFFAAKLKDTPLHHTITLFTVIPLGSGRLEIELGVQMWPSGHR